MKPVKPDIRLVAGSSGSGKTRYVIDAIKGSERIIAWDPKGEYKALPGFVALSSIADLATTLRSAQTGRFAFVPRTMKAFDLWAKVAYAWGHCDVIGEELADVTSPGKAPEGWGWIVRRGRERRLRVFGITQRPAESDKTILGNASLIRVCAMVRFDDRRYMAKELGLAQSHLDSLDFERQEWIEWNVQKRTKLRGDWSGKRPRPVV